MACGGDMGPCTEVPPVILLPLLAYVPDGDGGGWVTRQDAFQDLHLVRLLDLLNPGPCLINRYLEPLASEHEQSCEKDVPCSL